MSEIINLEIKADQSGADEALKQVNKSLKEGTEAAEALNHVLDGDLAGTFKSLGELSTIGFLTTSTLPRIAFGPITTITCRRSIAGRCVWDPSNQPATLPERAAIPADLGVIPPADQEARETTNCLGCNPILGE